MHLENSRLAYLFPFDISTSHCSPFRSPDRNPAYSLGYSNVDSISLAVMSFFPDIFLGILGAAWRLHITKSLTVPDPTSSFLSGWNMEFCQNMTLTQFNPAHLASFHHVFNPDSIWLPAFQTPLAAHAASTRRDAARPIQGACYWPSGC